jgi:hypothetical protein
LKKEKQQRKGMGNMKKMNEEEKENEKMEMEDVRGKYIEQGKIEKRIIYIFQS